MTCATPTLVRTVPPAAPWPTVAMSVSVLQLTMAPTVSTRLMLAMETPVGILAPARFWRLVDSGGHHSFLYGFIQNFMIQNRLKNSCYLVNSGLNNTNFCTKCLFKNTLCRQESIHLCHDKKDCSKMVLIVQTMKLHLTVPYFLPPQLPLSNWV